MSASGTKGWGIWLASGVVAFSLVACGGGSGSDGGGAAGSASSGTVGTTPGTPSNPQPPAPTPLFAGAAAQNITPGPGVPLGGFGAAPRRDLTFVTVPLMISAAFGNCLDLDPSDAVSFFNPNQGIHDPIFSKAVVLSNGVTKAAIVKLDTIGVSGELRQDLAAYASTLGIPSENLILCATHTHSGPGSTAKNLGLQLVAMDCFHQPTYDAMLAGIKASLAAADQALRPAVVGFASGQEPRIQKNRSGRNTILDPEVLLMTLEEPNGAAIATVFNFAVHGTVLGVSNMLFSSDLMGYAEAEVEGRLGGVAVFLNGAEGDVAPGGAPGLSGFAKAADLGGKLGDTVVQLAQGVQGKSGLLEVRSDYSLVQLPPVTYNAACLPVPGTNDTLCSYIPGFTVQVPLTPYFPAAMPFQALRLNDVVFGTIPGEAITEIGWDVKAAGLVRGFRHTFVVGLANDYMGYITTQDQYITGTYAAQSTLYGPTTGASVINALEARFDAVK
ncbi:MAG: neutral/alkaline non-lysosomal ceramidase N-terminal domain-containing protein [Planctomycetota bacterium]|jgi:hypothetical protein